MRFSAETNTNIMSARISTLLKCLVFWVLFLLVLLVTGRFLRPLFPPNWEQFVYGTGGSAGAFLITWLFIRNEGKSLRSYALNWEIGSGARFFKGIFWGAAIFAVIIMALLFFGGLQIQRSSQEWEPVTILWYLYILPLAFMEELAFRSYPFLKLKKVFGLRYTQFIVAIAFALYHVVNGWGWAIAFLGPGTWAFIFGIAAIWSKGIAMPTGIHLALNVSQQLVGMKGGAATPLWELTSKVSVAPGSSGVADTIGLLIQILVLITGLLLTEMYIRKKGHRVNTN